MLSYSQRKSFALTGAGDISARVKNAVEELAAQREAGYAAAKQANAERNQPLPFTDDEYRSAVVVRDRFGWHKVVKVNAQSVTVETEYSWTDRIARTKVLEVRS